MKASGNQPVVMSPRLHNRVIDAMAQVERQQLSAPVKAASGVISQTSVRVKNNAGNLARGSVLRVDGHLLNEYDAEHLWFDGKTPNDDSRFGILRQPTSANEIADLQLAGVCLARLVVQNSNHTHARPVAGQTYLESSWDGPLVILDKDGDEAVVVFRNTAAQPIRFELTTNLDLGGTATAQRCEFNGSTWVGVGDSFNITDFTGESWQGVAGFQGWCQKMPDSDLHEIVWMESFAKFVDFTLLANMSSGAATATVNQWYDGKQPTATPINVTDPHGLFSRALLGAKGKARYNPKTDKYVITECQTKAGRIEVELDGEMTSSGAAATVTAFGGTQQDIQNPGSVLVYDPQEHFTLAIKGAKGVAEYDAATDRYNLVECDSLAGIIEVTLQGPFIGGEATADVTDHYGTQQDWQEPAGSTVTIYDEQGCFPRARSGAKCKAILDSAANKYRAFWCEQMATAGTATLDATMDSSGVTFTDFTVTSASPSNLAPDPLPEAGLNPFLHRGMSGDEIRIEWDDSQSDWIVTDVERIEAEIIVKVEGTGLLRLESGKLQGYTLTTSVERSSAPQWKDLLNTTDECG